MVGFRYCFGCRSIFGGDIFPSPRLVVLVSLKVGSVLPATVFEIGVGNFGVGGVFETQVYIASGVAILFIGEVF